jgi:hypothetical protein
VWQLIHEETVAISVDGLLQETVSVMDLLKAGRRTCRRAFLQLFLFSYPTKKTEEF